MVGELVRWVSTRRGRWALWAALDACAAALLCLAMMHSADSVAVRDGADSVAVRDGASLIAGTALAVVGCAGVALRRLAPAPVALIVAAAVSALTYDGFAKDPMVAVALTLYTVGVGCTWLVSAGTLAAALVGVAVSARLPMDRMLSSSRVVATVVVLGAAWSIGVAMRTQRRYAAGLVRQAEERAQAQADRAERALVEQRLRIARELHDVVAHTISVIAVQAGVGAHVAASRPQESRRVLGTIEESSRTALAELRHLLGVLRAGDTGGAALAPAPTLDALPALLDQTRATGLAIDLSTTGVPRPLPAGIELAAYRIVQEALTNVVRHAGATRVRVDLRYQPERLAVTVTDDGHGTTGHAGAEQVAAERAAARQVGAGQVAAGQVAAGHVFAAERAAAERAAVERAATEHAATEGAAAERGAAGHGIAGMRERATLYGGACVAGPVPGGYRVSATLPVTGSDLAAA
jgi:signal transduction histidine kinase